ncbi:MAG: alpha/beta hydrolase [Nocardia sp.]|uniref:alpha/beta fold hydrolase n=1 Tax=Nocardia sp. TaxID=1821 RepID=UPI00262405BB|nr:alpha/beta hydrolase [Nocardia sp.]MCU1647786.1 alpha/beta hydrolase [Nocardia sp.]
MSNAANDFDSNHNNSTWTGTVTVDDTALAVTDTGGAGMPVIYLNGSYATQRSWRPVIAELGTGWRHITFDERARGKSKKSADYSFEACLRDIDAVLAARGVQQALIVGWSYGAALAVQWAASNPGRVAGVVMVDGGYPWDYLATVDNGDREAGRQEIRRLFKKLRFPMMMAAMLGLTARMTAAQAAEVNIELNEIVAVSDPVFDQVTFPMRFIVGSGAAQGATEEGHAAMRATLDPIIARNPNVQMSAKVTSNHTDIVRKDFRAIAAAVGEIAAAQHSAVR